MSGITSVCFPNRSGLRLSGILHTPEPTSTRGVCVLLLSPGVKGRVGPHRLYLKVAAGLVAMGFHVLRFDFHGLGDSEGELEEHVLASVYNSVQGGRYVDDTCAAMDWLQKTHGIRTFVASGLCGGSISGLLAASVDDRIRSVLALGLPVALEGGPEEWGRHLTRGQLAQLRQGYLRKALSLRSWKRFLRGRSSYRVIWDALRRKPSEQQSSAAAQPDNTNPLFAPAFFALARSGRPILLVFSGADRLGFEFREKFIERHSRELTTLPHAYHVHTIEHANHVLSDPGWVAEFLQVSRQWLDAHHPPDTAAAGTV